MKHYLILLRAIISSFYFNFKYLPFHQAKKFPILMYKPYFMELKGKVIIESENIYFGMIRMGFWNTLQYPNSGIVYENQGGTIVFKGKCKIGNASSISVGKKAYVEFGNDFCTNAALKLLSVRSVVFGKFARLGWDTLIMDTGFHPLVLMESGKRTKPSSPIKIGDYNWLSSKCCVLHGVTTPERCIFGLGSILTKKIDCKPYSLLVGTPPKVVKTGIYRDYDNDIEIIE